MRTQEIRPERIGDGVTGGLRRPSTTVLPFTKHSHQKVLNAARLTVPEAVQT